MPYIKQDDRPQIDEVLNPLIEYLRTIPEENQDGCVNYAVSRLIRHVYPLRYRHQNRAIGVLECIKQEQYRRIVGPYENKKIAENGDVDREPPTL